MSNIPNPKSFAVAYLDMAGAISAAFRRPNVLALLTVLAVLVTFCAFVYMLLEHWSFLNAVYFCVVTMSTVGYGDFAPHTALGKVFTIFYLFVGIGLFVLAVTAIAEAIFSEFRARTGK
jgi:voltage-gated potassium channel